MFQGQPLTPFSQTAQTSRSGFESLLGVIRDEIALKRQADALKKQVAVEKELIQFRGDEQLRINEATRDQTIEDQLSIYQGQKDIDLEYQKKLYESVTEPKTRLELAAEARSEFIDTQIREKRLFMDSFRKDYGSIYGISSAPVPLDFRLDPNTLDGIVTIPDGRDESGVPKYKEVTTQELFAEAEQWKNVANFLSNIETNFNDLNVNSTIETAEGGEISNYTLVGRNEGTEIIREVRAGTELGNQYVNKILNGELKLNVKKENRQEEELQKKINSDYGAFLTQYSIFAANDGQFRVKVDRTWWEKWYDPTGIGSEVGLFNFKTDSVTEILGKYNKLITETGKTVEQLSTENPDLVKFISSFETMLGHYFRSNPEAAQNPDNVYLNFDYNSNDPYSLFTRNPSKSTNPNANVTIEESIIGGSSSLVKNILNQSRNR